MNRKKIEPELRMFIKKTFLIGEKEEITSTDSLTKKGIVDSIGIIELIDFISSINMPTF